jgi:hypothetical protein
MRFSAISATMAFSSAGHWCLISHDSIVVHVPACRWSRGDTGPRPADVVRPDRGERDGQSDPRRIEPSTPPRRHHIDPLDNQADELPSLAEVSLRPQPSRVGVQDSALPPRSVDQRMEPFDLPLQPALIERY